MLVAEKFWDGVAAKYAKSPIKDQAGYQFTLDRTRSYLKESDTVLEIGAGTGGTALLLADAVSEIIASDISNAMLDVGRDNAKAQGVSNVRFMQSDAAQLPDGPYDVILAHNILHLIKDLPQVLEAVHEQLRPGGLFISKTFCKPKRGLQLEYRMIRLVLPLMQRLGKAPFVALRSVEILEEMIWAAGFEPVETANYPETSGNRYIVARKR
ncbi:MAG: class I SAM-dependent methyltransferase [Cognatishimia sp.]